MNHDALVLEGGLGVEGADAVLHLLELKTL